MKPKFYRKVLKDGMTVILEKRAVPVVSVAFAVRAGGINEIAEEKGISHFVEHLLYKGTPTRNSKKIAEEIEKRGGDLNGFTSEAITAYWCKMPSKHLKVALSVLSDMVKNPLFEEKEIEKERKVIFEEMKMYTDNPRTHVFEEIHKALYEEPFGIPLIGTVKSLGSITREKLLKKFKEVYTPQNMILVVVGDADFDFLVSFVERHFGTDKGYVPRLNIGEKNDSRVEKRKGIDQANLIFAYHVPKGGDDKSYAAVFLNTLMAGGLSSRLFNEIREKRNLAYAIKGDSNIGKDYAYNLIYVGTSKENVEKVRKLIIEEFDKVSKSLSKGEFREIKEQLIGNHYISMEESQVQMVNLLAAEIEGNAKKFYDFEEKIRKVRIKDVQTLAKKAKDKHSFFALVPA